MRVLTGDDTGLVKIFDVERSNLLMKYGEQQRGNGIDHLVFYNDNNEDLVLSCSQDTTLSMYGVDYEKKEETLYSCYQIEDAKKPVPVRGLHKIRQTDKIVYTLDNNETYTLKYDQEEGNFSDVVSVYKPQNQKDVLLTKINSTQKQLLVLSKGVNPQVIDIEHQKQAWKSRNVPNDWLDLQVPIWDVDGRFINQNEKNIMVITAYQKIRLYDLNKKNPQPYLDVQIDDKKLKEKSPFTSMELSHCDNYLYVSNKLGSIFKFDRRKDFNMVGKIKGSTGTIKQIQRHPTLPYLATIGLDRIVRVYNENDKLVGKQSMGQKLSSLLFSAQTPDNQEEFEEEAQETLQYTNYKEENKITASENRENKKKFQGMKKQTIKLEYLQKKPKQVKESGLVEGEQRENVQQQQGQQQVQQENDNEEKEDYDNEGYGHLDLSDDVDEQEKTKRDEDSDDLDIQFDTKPLPEKKSKKKGEEEQDDNEEEDAMEEEEDFEEEEDDEEDEDDDEDNIDIDKHFQDGGDDDSDEEMEGMDAEFEDFDDEEVDSSEDEEKEIKAPVKKQNKQQKQKQQQNNNNKKQQQQKNIKKQNNNQNKKQQQRNVTKKIKK